MKKVYILGTAFCYRDDQWPIARVTVQHDPGADTEHKNAFVVNISISFAGLEITHKVTFFIEKGRKTSGNCRYYIAQDAAEWIYNNFLEIHAEVLEERIFEAAAYVYEMNDPDAAEVVASRTKGLGRS